MLFVYVFVYSEGITNYVGKPVLTLYKIHNRIPHFLVLFCIYRLLFTSLPGKVCTVQGIFH